MPATEWTDAWNVARRAADRRAFRDGATDGAPAQWGVRFLQADDFDALDGIPPGWRDVSRVQLMVRIDLEACVRVGRPLLPETAVTILGLEAEHALRCLPLPDRWGWALEHWRGGAERHPWVLESGRWITWFFAACCWPRVEAAT